MSSRGRVILIGAGPGDADLLTLRGARKLGEADLVLYDALVSDDMRAHAPKATWFFVGKRANRPSIPQETINRLLIKHARHGKIVARLKCGDPFVFGRGGEEAMALAEAGIPVEVVPGISSAIAGPGLLGIPVTHRGAASGFMVVTGHSPERYQPILRALPAAGMTLVVLMGLVERARIAQTLLDAGWDRGTPAALAIGAGTPAAHRWIGSLGDLAASTIPDTSAEAPGIIVVGAVVDAALAMERTAANAPAIHVESVPTTA